MVTEPTRIYGSSRTCIDHVFQRFPTGQYDSTKIKYKLYDVQFSDHKLTHFELPRPPSASLAKDKITITNWEAVANRIATYNWAQIQQNSDVNVAFSLFINIIHQIINAESRTKLPRELNKKRSCWASSELVGLSESKLKLYKLVKKYPRNEFLKAQLKRVTKDLRSKIKSDKKAYFTKKLDLCGSDPKKYWRLIKNTLSSPQFSVQQVETDAGLIRTEGNEKTVSNAFNSFYVDKVAEILSSAPGRHGDSGSGRSYVCSGSHRLRNTFRSSPITKQT